MRKAVGFLLVLSTTPLVTAGAPSPFDAGALGAAALFTTPAAFDGEASVGGERAAGRASSLLGDERSARVETVVATSGRWRLGEDVSFGATVRRESRRYESTQTSRGAAALRETETRGRADLAAGPSLWLGSLGLAGTVGAALLERETFTRDDASGTTASTTEPVTVPSLTAAAGWRARRVLVALQTRLYDSALTSVETRPAAGPAASRDVSRKPPNEIALHGRLEALDDLALGLSLEHVANESDAEGTVIVPQHATLTARGVYRTPSKVDLFTSLRLEESAFDDARPPSLRYENLGGSRLAVGLDVGVGALGVNLALGYSSSGRVPHGGDTWEQKAWDLTAGVSSRY